MAALLAFCVAGCGAPSEPSPEEVEIGTAYSYEMYTHCGALEAKFAGKPDILAANIAALNAGHAFGETAELSGPMRQYAMPAAPAVPGLYRTVTGAESISLGLVAGAQLAGLPMFFGGYPITPASAILHHLSRLKEYHVTTFQAEDEIAAICAAIGASYAGSLGVTSSSGPGIALKGEVSTGVRFR